MKYSKSVWPLRLTAYNLLLLYLTFVLFAIFEPVRRQLPRCLSLHSFRLVPPLNRSTHVLLTEHNGRAASETIYKNRKTILCRATDYKPQHMKQKHTKSYPAERVGEC